MRKVMVVVTSRASYARIKSVLKATQAHPELELVTVGAASLLLEKYGAGYKSMESDGIPLGEKVYMVVEGEIPTTMAKTVGIGIMELATVFDNHRPDVVISIADRFETIATAIAASYLNIPVAHVQGGEVTGSIDEKVRHAVTKLASIHFVATQRAAERVRRMGEEPDRIHVTGCPSVDLAAAAMKRPDIDYEFYDRYRGVGEQVDLNADYIVCMQHPVTTDFESAYDQAWETLVALDELRVPTLLFWPNMDAGSDLVSKAIRVFRERHKPEYVYCLKNMLPRDFLVMLLNSKCIVGNSSVGIRECSFMGVPAVNIGDRQAGRERGRNVTDVQHDREAIAQAVRAAMERGHTPPEPIYGDGQSGERIANLLAEAPLKIDKIFCD